MKFSSSALTLGLFAPILIHAESSNTNASPAHMQRLTRRNAVDLSSSSNKAASGASANTFARRNATTFVARQDKVDPTVSNSTTTETKSSTIGDVVEKHLQEGETQLGGNGSPYLVANALRLMHEGVVLPHKRPVGVAKRGEEDGSNQDMSITTSVVVDGEDDEDCEEEEDDEDDEECEDAGEDAEECEEDDEDEDCDDDDEADDEEDCEEQEGEDNAVSPIGGAVGFSSVDTPSSLAQGSLKGNEGCTKFATAASGDSCYKLIGAKDQALLEAFYKNNPSVESGCKNLKIGSTYCVSSSSVAPAAPLANVDTKVKSESSKVEQKQQEEEEPKKVAPVQPKAEGQKPAPVEEPKKEQEQPVKAPKPQQNDANAGGVKTDVKVEIPAPIKEQPKEEQPKKEAPSSNEGGKKAEYSGKASYYFQHGNAGACGKKRGDGDFIVALHPSLYNGGARCGNKISLTNKATGKTLVAEVADLCPTCEDKQVDLSKGLFDALGNGADGIFQVEYGFL